MIHKRIENVVWGTDESGSPRLELIIDGVQSYILPDEQDLLGYGLVKISPTEFWTGALGKSSLLVKGRGDNLAQVQFEGASGDPRLLSYFHEMMLAIREGNFIPGARDKILVKKSRQLYSSNAVLNRFEKLLALAFSQVKAQCTDDNLRKVWAKYQISLKDSNLVYKEDMLSEILSNENWLIIPDIEAQLFSILRQVYEESIQPVVDSIWANAYSKGIVESVLPPGIGVAEEQTALQDRATMICDVIDRGTINYLSRLLREDGGKDFESIRHLMFDVGGSDEDTIADFRVRNIVNTETCWARNWCRLNVLKQLGFQNKYWIEGTRQCKVATINFNEGIVPIDFVYDSGYGDKVAFPPGCVGCDCNIFSEIDDDLVIDGLRQIDGEKPVDINGLKGSGIVCIEAPQEFSSLLGVKDPHITVTYLAACNDWGVVEFIVKKVCSEIPPFAIYLTGETKTMGVPGVGDVDAALVRVGGKLALLRRRIEEELREAKIVELSEWTDWQPHITLGPKGTDVEAIEDFGGPWVVEEICIWIGDVKVRYELIGPQDERSVILPLQTPSESIVEEKEQKSDLASLKGVIEGVASKGFICTKSSTSFRIVHNGSEYEYSGDVPTMVVACLTGPDPSIIQALEWVSRNGYEVSVAQYEKSVSQEPGRSEQSALELAIKSLSDLALVKSGYPISNQKIEPVINVNAEMKMPEGFAQTDVYVNVDVPEQKAPIIKNEPRIEVNVPERKSPMIVLKPEIKVEVPKQERPVVKVSLPQTKIENKIFVPEGPTPQVNVAAKVELPEEEITEVVKDEKGSPKAFKKRRIYRK